MRHSWPQTLNYLIYERYNATTDPRRAHWLWFVTRWSGHPTTSNSPGLHHGFAVLCSSMLLLMYAYYLCHCLHCYPVTPLVSFFFYLGIWLNSIRIDQNVSGPSVPSIHPIQELFGYVKHLKVSVRRVYWTWQKLERLWSRLHCTHLGLSSIQIIQSSIQRRLRDTVI